MAKSCEGQLALADAVALEAEEDTLLNGRKPCTPVRGSMPVNCQPDTRIGSGAGKSATVQACRDLSRLRLSQTGHSLDTERSII